MADTAAGAALTDAHRIAQVELSQQAIAAALVVWAELNPGNLAATRERWLQLLVTLIGIFDVRSAELAVSYLQQFRSVEGNPDGPIEGRRDFKPGGTARVLDYNGPATIIRHIKAGMQPAEAKRRVQQTMVGAVQRQVLEGGRRVVDLSALSNPVSKGWRRVADSDPCTFCALMASRGPVYRSESSAGSGRKYHNKCGCTVEEVFGQWRPNRAEQAYVDAYDEAALELRRQRLPLRPETVLPLMRSGGSFRDSPPPAAP